MAQILIDCRGKTVAETGMAIFKTYNSVTEGTEFLTLIDAYSAGLRIWLIEGGARHEALQDDLGHWQLKITRGISPGQGTIPGLHHVATAPSDRIWTCERAERLACIDSDSGEVLKTGKIATKASHIAVDTDEKWVYVADPGENVLLAIDARDMSVKHTWPAPGGPQLPLVTDAGIACVTGAGTGSLTIVRPSGDDFDVQTIKVGSCPHDPVTSLDGTIVYVPCAGDGTIVKVRLSDGHILGRYQAGDGASHVALHPDGTRLYVANTFDGTATCLSVEGDIIAHVPSGRWAHQPEITPDGSLLYVANFLDDTLSVFDAETLDKKADLPTETYAHGLDISPDGKFAIATGFGSDHVRIYDAMAAKEITRIKVGQGSSHSAFTSQSDAAFIGCSVSDHLAKVDLNSAECTSIIAI